MTDLLLPFSETSANISIKSLPFIPVIESPTGPYSAAKDSEFYLSHPRRSTRAKEDSNMVRNDM